MHLSTLGDVGEGTSPLRLRRKASHFVFNIVLDRITPKDYTLYALRG